MTTEPCKHVPAAFYDKHFVYEWAYRNQDGAVLGYTARYEDDNGKKVVLPCFKGNGKNFTFGGLTGGDRPLFGLQLLPNHDRNEPIYILEGEKCAAAMQSLGMTALTSIGGAQAAAKTDWLPLSQSNEVILVPDNDEAGEFYMKSVYRLLMDVYRPPAVKVLRLSGLPDKGDFVDWIRSKPNTGRDAWKN